MASILGQIPLPEDDTLQKLLSTYQAPTVSLAPYNGGTDPSASPGGILGQVALVDPKTGLDTTGPVGRPVPTFATNPLASLQDIGRPSVESRQMRLADTDYDALAKKDADYAKPAQGILGHIGHFFRPSLAFEEAPIRARIAQDEQGLREQQQLNLASNKEQNIQAENATPESQEAKQAALAHTNAETRSLNANADIAEQGKYQVLATPQGYLRVNAQDPSDAQYLSVDGKPVGAPVKTEIKQIEIGGKPHQVLFDDKGNQIKDLGETGEKPPTIKVDAGAQSLFIPDGKGGFTLQRVLPGQSVGPGALTASGVNSGNAPTSQQRNAATRADLVLQSIPDVMTDLDTNGAQLGPGMGRFNDIYTGKIGAPNPEFAGLMADLHLMGTAVALAHAQGRMSNELLNEFNSMIASPQQTPANIKAVLNKVQNYMQRSANQGKPASSNSGGSPSGTTFKFDKNGNPVK